MNWIKAIRLTTTLRLGVLTLIGFHLGTGVIDGVAWSLAVFVTLGASATMVLNDWVDRKHDRLKGKDFAYLHEETFLVFALVLWELTVLLSFYVWYLGAFYGVISLTLILIGFFYSYSRHILALPAVLVAFASALPTLLPLAQGTNDISFLLFLLVFFFVLGREILKDMDDPHDKGYKRTLQDALGFEGAKKIVAALFVVVLTVLFFLPPWVLFGVPAVGYTVWILLDNRDHWFAKRLMDYNTLLVLALLFL